MSVTFVIASGQSIAAACAEGVKCKCWCLEDRSFEGMSLFEFPLRTTSEFRHRTGDAIEEPRGPAILVDRTRLHRSDRHDHIDIGIRYVDIDAQVQFPVL